MKLKINIKNNNTWAGILLAQFLLFYTLSHSEKAISFFERNFEKQKKFQQQLSSGFTFSLGDAWYIFLILLMMFGLFKILKKTNRKRYILMGLLVLNMLYFSYQIYWGMLYFQPPIKQKLNKREPNTEDAKRLALVYLEKCRRTRNSVPTDRNGVFKAYSLESIEKEIIMRQQTLPAALVHKEATGIVNFKPSLFKSFMSFTGILGYYNPFTGEAQYNPNLPSTYLPFTLAHESAHQLGYAKEQEANFIGYLIGKNSSNISLRYSTEYYVLKSLLNAISEEDPAFVKTVIKNYSEGMKKDRMAEKMFVLRHTGFMEVFFGITNNLFLKSNRQDGAITYSYFINLLLRYET